MTIFSPLGGGLDARTVKKDWILLFKEGMPEKTYLQHEKEIREIFGFFTDEKSKDILFSVMRCRCGKEHLLSELWSDDMYYPAEIEERLTSSEVFCDCGAYTGDTIEEFIEKTCNEYEGIYGFELDAGNFKKMSVNARLRDPRISLYPFGIGKSNGEVMYASCGGMGSSYKVFAGKESRGQIRTLDGLRQEGTLTKKITYVKMDIEGAELDALQGMESILRDSRPTLAICLYHRIEDLWTIPRYLKEIVPSYRLMLRHHSPSMQETVLYAL